MFFSKKKKNSFFLLIQILVFIGDKIKNINSNNYVKVKNMNFNIH